jgi:23S rRNA pseudouridine1911/1915/1917 synthase
MHKNFVELHDSIPSESSGERLDQALAKLFPQYSRSQLQTWIRNGFVSINGQTIDQVRLKVSFGQVIDIHAPLVASERWEAQPIPLEIIFEDESLLIINKPAGLVVHPGAGTPDNTLINALLHYSPTLSTLPRAGIIHRLDKDTSGLLVIARTLTAHHALIKQMKARQIEREYEAIVKGLLIAGGTIEANIGRHPTHRTRMAVVESGREAITHYRVIERFRAHTHLRIQLETGRTHQIRVHLTHIHHPIVGDPVYGHHVGIPTKLSEKLKIALQNFKRQALHAANLRLTHPVNGQWMEWHAPLPKDFVELLKLLREDSGKVG